MELVPISLDEIRPYIRFMKRGTISHSDFVVPYEHRLIFVEEGSARIIVEDTEYTVNKNELLYIPAGVHYRQYYIKDCVSIYIYFDLTMKNQNILTPVKPKHKLEDNDLFCNRSLVFEGNPVSVLKIPPSARIRDDISGIEKNYQRSTTMLDKNILSGIMISIISKMLLKATISNANRSTSNVVAKVVEYVSNNFNKKLSLAMVSKELNFHQSYISRCIRKELGMSFENYCNKYRMDHAIQLLMYYDLSVARVAEKVGFKEPKYFSYVFKKYFGFPPSKIKRDKKSSLAYREEK